MKTEHQLRLWRVLWVHRSGYQAPSHVVEAKTKKEAVSEVKESRYRLADFPESWSYHLIDSGKVQRNGKWYNS